MNERTNERAHTTLHQVLSVFDGWLSFIGCIKWIASQANTMALSQIHWIWLCCCCCRCCLFSLMLSLSSCANDNFYQIFVVFVVVSKLTTKANQLGQCNPFGVLLQLLENPAFSWTKWTTQCKQFRAHLELSHLIQLTRMKEIKKKKAAATKPKTKRAIHQPEIASEKKQWEWEMERIGLWCSISISSSGAKKASK